MTPKNSELHGHTNTGAAYAPAEPESKRAAETSSHHGGVLQQDAEYEEVDDLDLVYERTGTLCFPYPSRRVDSGVRATEAAAARTTEAPAVAPERSAMSSVGRLVRDLRAASASTPGVSMLATIDVVGGEGASVAQRPQPPPQPSGAEAKAHRPAPASAFPVLAAPPPLPQRVAVGPAFPPPRRSSGVANRALSKAAHTFVAPPSSLASRQVGPSRARDARSFTPVRNGKRTTQPSLARQRALQLYPTFGQRILAEVQRIPLATSSVALGVVAAVVVAAVFLASSTLLSRRAPPERAAPRSKVSAVAEGRARRPAPELDEPRVSVVAEEEALPEEPPKTLEPPELDVQRTGERSKGAKATRSNRRASTRSGLREPCDCFPGDPLCGCLD
jgi:hypothetical protein